METPQIFSGTAVKLATSAKQDGHTSFSHASDQETEANINRFMDGLEWNDVSRAFLIITYNETDTYDTITVVDDGNKPPRKFTKAYAFEVDALVTNQPGIALLLPTADCYPVVIFDPKNEVLALCHIGWHSTAARLLEKTIERMKTEYGSNAGDLLVHIGPGIPAKYYVFEEPAQLKMPGWKPYLKRTDKGWGIDLLGYNLNQLKQAGVMTKHIAQDPRNTVESQELESNYMHNQQGLPTARRFLTAVMLNNS